jgi:hypothetical protein
VARTQPRRWFCVGGTDDNSEMILGAAYAGFACAGLE